MTAAVRIRAALAADLPALTELGLLLSRQHYDYDPARYDLFAGVAEPGSGFPQLQRDYLARQLNRPEARLLVAEDANRQVVGYAFGALEAASFELGLKEAGWIHDILLTTAARGTGAGQQLLAALIEELRQLGAPAIMLHTAVQNLAAQSWFRRYGFRPTMLEMRLELPPAA